MSPGSPPTRTRHFEPEKWPLLNTDSTAYRSLALELIFLCRFFTQAHEKSSNSSIRLKRLLIAADDALKSAAEDGESTSKEVDEKFREVIDLLCAFEKDFPSKDPTSGQNICGRTKEGPEANISDKFNSPSTILGVLKQNLHATPMGHEWPRPTRVVKFLLLSSLPDTHPIIVEQMLSDSPSFQEILWNFSRFKDEKNRLTLKDNPHFYAELPSSPEAYSENVKIEPTEDFRHANEFYVLIDKPKLVHVMSDQISEVFGNFWCPKDAIIFKDIGGTLRGEGIVKASLRGTYCGFCKQLPVSTVPKASRHCLGNRHGLHPIVTEGWPWTGWKCLNGCLPMHSSVDTGLRVCTGRTAPDSLLLVPFPPTSERPGYRVAYRTHIHDIDHDSLLQIFDHCQLNQGDDWNLRHMWWNLAHVCQTWRHLVYYSSSLLDTMCLSLTNGSPSLDSLNHVPLLPLVVNYSDGTRTMARKDENNIRLGLQQHGRVRGVVFRASSLSLRIWLQPMNQLFPKLRDLFLKSTTTEEMDVVLPEALQAPDLRHLSLHGITLPTPLLSSTISLSTLSLTHIGASCYFPPGHLVTQLQGLPHLEELSIGFAIPIPLQGSEQELLPNPIPPVTLPTLRQLTFRGVSVYLDNLVAQIHAPLLERLDITLFLELDVILMNLNNFIQRTKGFANGCVVARVIFNKDGASIVAGYHEQHGIGKLDLHVNCIPLDWQIDSATQVCNALRNAVLAVEELTLDLDVAGMPSNWENILDSMMWHELLLAFTGVKRLHVGSSLTREFSQALESVSGELALELLPGLQELKVPLMFDNATRAFSSFMKFRESVDRPIRLALPTPSLDETIVYLRDHYPTTRLGTEDNESCLKDLVRCYNAKISQTDDTTFIDYAVRCNKRLLAIIHPTNKSKFLYISSFASFLYSAFSLTKRVEYLDDAIAQLRQVLQLDASGARQIRFVATQRLIGCLEMRWQLDGRQYESPDLDEVMDLFTSGVKDTYAMVHNRLDLAFHWAKIARISGHHSLSTAYENVMSLMQSSLVFAPTLSVQHNRLVEKHDLYRTTPLNFASHHIGADQLERAIEVLEHGRALIWSEMRGLRTSTDRIRAVDPVLADRFTAINQELEIVTTSALSDGNTEMDGEGSEGDEWTEKYSGLMNRQYKLLTERDALIPQIRELPGLKNFLLPHSFDTLRSAASLGPVIIINHCTLRSDIIIVLHNSPPSCIPTPSDFFDRTNQLKAGLLKARKDHGLNSKEHAIADVLKELYELVGLPVVKRLNDLGIPEQSRVWWCPTSAFWDLPLHAMGPIPSDNGVIRYFSDLYISSYTPTLAALIASRRPGAKTSARPTLLVSQHSHSPPGGWQDTLLIRGLDLQTTILPSGNLTPTTLLDNVQSRQASHIPYDVARETAKAAKPFDAAMLFHNEERLTLLDIMLSRQRAGEAFAFLPGSLTAEVTDECIPDEVLHFSTAMQYTGYRSVIGTMWGMDDEDGLSLAKHVYRSMFLKNEGVEPYYERSARALHYAVQQIRPGLPLVRWVNFVHYGA